MILYLLTVIILYKTSIIGGVFKWGNLKIGFLKNMSDGNTQTKQCPNLLK